MVSKFWLYLGIILACSGIGTVVGIVLIILYVWGDIRESIDNASATDKSTKFQSEIIKKLKRKKTMAPKIKHNVLLDNVRITEENLNRIKFNRQVL